MSTGNLTYDNRYEFESSCGLSRAGLFYSKVWAGEDSPNPRKRSENPYSMVLTSINDSPITWKFTNGATVYTGSPESCGFAPEWTHATWDANDEAKLLSKVQEAIRGHEFNAFVSLGEGRESVQMIAQTAKALAASFSSLRKGDAFRALKALGVKPRSSRVKDVQHDLRHSAGQAWLGMTYGWKPLLSNVADAAEALASNNERALAWSYTATVRKAGTVQGAGGSFTAKGYCTSSTRLKVTLTQHQTWLESMGFTRPELVAWELLPFSFVVDWFLPIGNWLDAVTGFRGMEGTYVRSKIDRARAEIGSSPSYQVLTGHSIRSGVSLTRTVGSISELSESLSRSRPRFKNPLSTSHVISAIALLQSVFQKR